MVVMDIACSKKSAELCKITNYIFGFKMVEFAYFLENWI